MSLDYKVIIRTSEPTEQALKENGNFWINPLVSLISLYINGWNLIGNDDEIVSYSQGTFNKSLINQENQPIGTLGDLWYQPTSNQMYVFLKDWVLI